MNLKDEKKMKKELIKPELLNYTVWCTEEELCYCEEGAIAEFGEAARFGGWKPGFGPGHPHKPNRPGRPCPSKPTPNPNPTPDQTPIQS